MMSLRTGIAQTVVGLAAGIAAALVLTRVLSGMLHGVTPVDLPTLAMVVLVTGVVAVVASVGPARRAARTDPMAVLHGG